MFVVDEENWSWILFQNQNDMYLTVLCGGVAMFNVDIQLTQTEIASYKSFGRGFIVELAESVAFNPGAYSRRKSNFRNEFDLATAIEAWRESK
ncbi:hypothetical protein [Pseudoalteromonas rubra]|uniref:hypothetical protein n=1 Tax=Pseudoalteromonas rubra TaxID=43658 RepID=UPI002DB5D1F5|nr:hypothetical protein [Pseudoalteromonas rubra]MEC4088084.1 hypothetical protein [Pseudoalteromonas rubra]